MIRIELGTSIQFRTFSGVVRANPLHDLGPVPVTFTVNELVTSKAFGNFLNKLEKTYPKLRAITSSQIFLELRPSLERLSITVALVFKMGEQTSSIELDIPEFVIQYAETQEPLVEILEEFLQQLNNYILSRALPSSTKSDENASPENLEDIDVKLLRGYHD